jgi:hypothetical protein
LNFYEFLEEFFISILDRRKIFYSCEKLPRKVFCNKYFFNLFGLQIYTSPSLCQVIVFVIPVIVGAFAVFGRLQRKYTLMMQEAIAGTNQVRLT